MLAKKQPIDVLRKLGKWTFSTEFTKKVADELRISISHAWRLIKKDKKILREKLPSGRVLCGLPEFGPLTRKEVEEKPSTEKPSRLNFWEYLKWRRNYNDKMTDLRIRELQCEQEIRLEIMNMNESDYTQKEEWKIRQKWRKRFGLDQNV